MMRSVLPSASATRRLLPSAALLGAMLALVHCQDPAEQCAGNVEVSCGPDECSCATGAFEGQSCEDKPNSTDPQACENLCCGQGEGVTGPGSILKGTK